MSPTAKNVTEINLRFALSVMEIQIWIRTLSVSHVKERSFSIRISENAKVA